MVEQPHHDVISEELSSDDKDESVDENGIASSTDSYETSQQISRPSDSSQCPLCNAVFSHRKHMLRHVRNKHEGVKYPCSQCDYKATQQNNLKIHIKAVHEGMIYPCSQCDYKTTRNYRLKEHIDLQHMC